MIYLDTETAGFHGMAVLLQYAINDGEIYLYELWKNTIGETLELLEMFCRHKGGICGFNLTFDWFHINKIYNVFRQTTLVHGDVARGWYPDEHIEEIACCEKAARDGLCLKPVKALDLFLHARKGEYQSTLDRKDIRIKRVPRQLARQLADELHKRIQFNKLYFARRKVELENPWQVMDITEKDGSGVNPDFKDIVLKFSPSSGLKALAVDAGIASEDSLIKFTDIECKIYPQEVGWAPFAEAIGEPGNWRMTWPDVIKYHIDHFSSNTPAREYSRLDIVYTRGLHKFFGSPDAGDDDSELACAIGAIRWKGFAVDIEGIKKLREESLELERTAPKSPGRVKDWIWPDLSEAEKMATGGSTGKVQLEHMATWNKVTCDDCDGSGYIGEVTLSGVLDNLPKEEHPKKCRCTQCRKCPKCDGKGTYEHPACAKARMVLDARKAKKETEIYDKLLQAGRFHASFKVIGTLSGRMAGADGLNPQGIKSTKKVRSKFPLAFEGEELSGGDFESFEVAIAVAIYKCPKLEADLNSLGMCPDCLGKGKIQLKDADGKKIDKWKPCVGCNETGQTKKKIHGLFGGILFEKDYDEIVSSKGSAKDMYTDGKRGVFSQLYGGDHNTLMVRLGIGEEVAKKAADGWLQKYTGVKKAQQRIFDMFCSMRQPDGIGSKVEWHEPERFIESLLGFRRYYDLENRICKVLFNLAEKPPKEWLNIKVTVHRRDRDQTATGAVRSALFGAAFQIQAANLRSGTNHEIQATGSGICKRTQRKIWDLQPSGVQEFLLKVLNIHDELMVPSKPHMKPIIEKVVREEVASFKPLIPMIAIDWSDSLRTWADK